LVEFRVCFVLYGAAFPEEFVVAINPEEGVGGSITLIPLVAAALEGLDVGRY